MKLRCRYVPTPKGKTTQCGTLRKEGATVIFALRRVILLRSCIMLRIVILPFGQF